MRTRVAITGVGLVCSVADDYGALEAALRDERLGIQPWFAFPKLRSRLGAPVREEIAEQLAEHDGLDPHEDRCLVLGLAGARQAIAGLELDSHLMVSIGLAGAEIGRIRRAYQDIALGKQVSGDRLLRTAGSLASTLARRLGISRGHLQVHQSACASGLTALGAAADALRAGECEMALAGGVEVLDLGLHAGFDGIRALSADACRPFDANRTGTVLGEASAFVLESEDHAVRRGARVYAEFAGYGTSNDAFHRTRPDPSGVGQAGAMVSALGDAEIDGPTVDLVYAHGTGTPANDEVELKAIGIALGERASTVPIVSVKGATGHTISASGPLNVLLGVLALNAGRIAGNVTLQNPIEGFEGWCLPKSSSDGRFHRVLVNAFAFGGNNAAAVVSRW
jgi:3-oxoacyl-[acyl-carrier-protein] synthase II